MLYMTAAMPAATAPASINPFLTVLELPAFPEALWVGLALVLGLVVALPVDELPEVVGVAEEEEPPACKAPNTPPCTSAGLDPCALEAADL